MCIAAAVLGMPAWAGCRRAGPPGSVVERRVLMGTEATVTAWDPDLPPEAVAAAVDDAFERMAALEGILSRHREDSDLNGLNRRAGQGPQEVEGALWRVLLRAREAFEASGGAFDPTVGPLVRLWIGAAKDDRWPTDEAVAGAKARTGFGRVRLEAVSPDRGRATVPEGFALDLGGIAKGFVVDEGAAVLRSKGVRNGLVEAGGDLFAFGARPDGAPWRVAVQDPAAGEEVTGRFVKVLGVSGVGVTTSGHYRRFSTIEGRRVSHILDPASGFPVEEAVLSVTVVAPDATRADGLSTAVAVLGPEKGLALVESLPGVEALILTAGEGGGYRLHQSPGMAAFEAR